MAAASIKYDDGSGAFVSNCFPVRNIVKYGEPGEGAWLEAHRAEQRRQFKAVICARPPRTYSRLKHERIAAERQNEESPEPIGPPQPTLDGFFLMKHCCIDDPADLCSVNIAGLGIYYSKPEDYQLFDNVAYVNAADNNLRLEIFNRFPIIRELELPLNSVSSISLSHKMFRNLEMLDLSYNSLTSVDLLQLGYLRNLKVLYLSGNNLEKLPENMAGFYVTRNGCKKRRFPKLEILCLDNNRLNNYTAFAPLAGLKSLKHLNLESNEISAVPQLEPKTIKHDNLSNEQEGEDVADDAEEMQAEEDEQEEGQEQKEDSNIKEPEQFEFKFGELKVTNAEVLTMTDNIDGEALQDSVEGDVPTDSEDELDDEDNAQAIPFKQLRFLTLAHNYICEEEDLLPLAAWPNITQAHIYDNPLTNERSGDPPMLKKFLTDRLGIELTRKKPLIPKPIKDFPPPRKDHKIESNIPPVPKCDVEKLLMIEASKRNALPSTPGKSPLPPIRTASESFDGQATSTHEEISKDEEKRTETTDKDTEAFFMTQVDDQFEGLKGSMNTSPQSFNPPPSPHVLNIPGRKVKAIADEQRDLFRGYEELLIEDEVEKTIKIPTDVQSSVKALQYTLKHPVVNNYTLRLDTNQKPFLPYKRSDVDSRRRPETKAEKISRAMESVRHMDTVIEAPLERAMTDKELQKKYPEAANLLKQIQRKYNNAKSKTMADAQSLRATVKNATTPRAHTDLAYMVDHDTSMTEMDVQRPLSNI